MLALSFLSCSSKREIRGQELTGLDRKLSTYSYIEEGNLVTFIVNTRATRYREGQLYIPLEVCVANNGLRMLTLTRESFSLIDEEGNRYPAAGPEELIERYEFLDFDRRFGELRGVVFNRFATYHQYGSKFSPTRRAVPFASTVVRDLVSLPRFGYLIDFLYFPAPRTGVMEKKFELFMDSSDLPDPVFVRFEVK